MNSHYIYKLTKFITSKLLWQWQKNINLLPCTAKDEQEQTLDSLPLDILRKVFLRLPVESLVRLTFTSYFFDDFIMNDLVYLHLERATPIVHGVIHNRKYVAERLNNQAVLSKFRNIKFSNPFHFDESFVLAGSYNGLVCFYQCSRDQYYGNYDRRNIWAHPLMNQENVEEVSNRIYLWNPALHQIRALPRSIGANDFVAFGHDPSSQDYKILWISRGKRKKAEVYSWKNKSWKIICKNFRYVPLDSRDAYIVGFEGSLHWISDCNYEFDQSDILVSAFNIADDRLDVYKVPEYAGWKANSLGMFRGSLSLMATPFTEPYSEYWNIWQIWSLDRSAGDCPWTKKLQFLVQSDVYIYHDFCNYEEIINEQEQKEYIRGLTASGKLMVSSQGREYELVDPDTISLEKLRIGCRSHSLFFIDYVESVISVYPPRRPRGIVS